MRWAEWAVTLTDARKVRTLSTFYVLFLITTIPLPVSAQLSTGNLFYFHYNSLLYRNTNSSVIVISEANLTPPNSTVSEFIDVAANIRNATTPFGTVWVGSVSWISPPLSQSQTLQGVVTITAWISSNDSQPSLSGIGGGIVILDNQNNIVGQPLYSYLYGQAGRLTGQANSYQFTLNINRNVEAGQRIVFAVGLGANVPGWRMRIYFDSLSYPTRAQLPETVVAVSEPSVPVTTTIALVGTLAAISQAYKKSRKRSS